MIGMGRTRSSSYRSHGRKLPVAFALIEALHLSPLIESSAHAQSPSNAPATQASSSPHSEPISPSQLSGQASTSPIVLQAGSDQQFNAYRLSGPNRNTLIVNVQGPALLEGEFRIVSYRNLRRNPTDRRPAIQYHVDDVPAPPYPINSPTLASPVVCLSAPEDVRLSNRSTYADPVHFQFPVPDGLHRISFVGPNGAVSNLRVRQNPGQLPEPVQPIRATPPAPLPPSIVAPVRAVQPTRVVIPTRTQPPSRSQAPNITPMIPRFSASLEGFLLLDGAGGEPVRLLEARIGTSFRFGPNWAVRLDARGTYSRLGLLNVTHDADISIINGAFGIGLYRLFGSHLFSLVALVGANYATFASTLRSDGYVAPPSTATLPVFGSEMTYRYRDLFGFEGGVLLNSLRVANVALWVGIPSTVLRFGAELDLLQMPMSDSENRIAMRNLLPVALGRVSLNLLNRQSMRVTLSAGAGASFELRFAGTASLEIETR